MKKNNCKKDIVIYAQKFQANGYYPVECFMRKSGIWSSGRDKLRNGREVFMMVESEMDDNYYFFVLKNNYEVFSNQEMHDARIMHKGNITLDNLKDLIFS